MAADDLAAEIANLRLAKSQLEAEVSTFPLIRNDLQNKKEELRTVRQQLAAAEDKLREFEGKLQERADQHAKVEALEGMLRNEIANNQKLGEQVAYLHRNTDTQRAELHAINAYWHAVMQQAAAERAAVDDRLRAAEAALAAAREDAARAGADAGRFRADVERALADVAAARKEAADAVEGARRAERAAREAASARDAASTRNAASTQSRAEADKALRERIAEMESDYAALKQTAADLERKAADAEVDAHEAKARAKAEAKARTRAEKDVEELKKKHDDELLNLSIPSKEAELRALAAKEEYEERSIAAAHALVTLMPFLKAARKELLGGDGIVSLTSARLRAAVEAIRNRPLDVPPDRRMVHVASGLAGVAADLDRVRAELAAQPAANVDAVEAKSKKVVSQLLTANLVIAGEDGAATRLIALVDDPNAKVPANVRSQARLLRDQLKRVNEDMQRALRENERP